MYSCAIALSHGSFQFVQPQTRKVSAQIPIEQHAALKVLSAKHGTTIEALLKFGIPLTLRKLKDDKRAAKALAPDHRISK